MRVQNPAIGAGAAALLVSTVTLTAADILALPATFKTLVPAPGAGKVIVPIFVALAFNVGAIFYETPSVGDFIDLLYGTTLDPFAPAVTGMISGVASTLTYEAGATASPYEILPGDDNKPLVLASDGSYNIGPVVTSTLGAGGLGYVANDTGTITTGNGDATYKVLTVGAGGAVLTYQITAPGTGYATGAGQATATGGAQPGVGLGFTVNITAVQAGNGTLKVVTYYQIILVP